METRQIKVQKRSETGSKAMRRLRKEGLVPAVVYAAGEEATQLIVGNHDLLMAVRGCRSTQIFTFQSEDSDLDGELAFIKEVQTEPIKDRVLHVDFLAVKKGRTVVIEVPIELTGEIEEVKQGLAVLEQRSYGLDLECLPKNIPDVIMVDISKLKPGQSIRASQIEIPEGATLRSSEESTIAAVGVTRAASIETEVGEGSVETAAEPGTAADADAKPGAEASATDEKKGK